MAGAVHPDEFRAFTVDNARHLSYLLRQRRARSRAQHEDAGPTHRDSLPTDLSPERSHSERELLAELGLE